MKNLVVCGVIAGLLGLFAVLPVNAQEQGSGKKIRILVITGGHGFEQAPFDKMFNDMKGVEYKKAVYPQAGELLKPGLEKECDVIIMYDMIKSITTEQQ